MVVWLDLGLLDGLLEGFGLFRIFISLLRLWVGSTGPLVSSLVQQPSLLLVKLVLSSSLDELQGQELLLL